MTRDERSAVLVTLADAQHVDAARQVFSSARHEGGWTGDFALLVHEGRDRVASEELDRFRSEGVRIIRCRPLFEGRAAVYPAVVFSKLYLFAERFKSWDHVVFLDADTIVRASLDPLRSVSGFRAVRAPALGLLRHQVFDYLQPAHHRKQIIERDPTAYRSFVSAHDLDRPAFNSGVMAFSTDIITERSFDELVRLTHEYRSIMKGDEGILNLYFYGSWRALPLAYNACARGVSNWRISDIDAGVVLHFLGDHKPWDQDHALYTAWRRNLERTDGSAKRTFSYLRILWLSQQQKYWRAKHKASITIEYLIGRSGEAMRRIAPWLYRSLKSVL